MPHLSSYWNRLGRSLGALCLAFTGQLVWAQSTPTYEEQYKQMRAPNAVTKVGVDLFGETVNLYNGTLEFRQTDVSLPGNDTLPVAVGRRIAAGEKPMEGKAFGRWELDIPHIFGLFPSSTGWISGNSDTNRCSAFGVPGSVYSGGAAWYLADYWQGAFLYVPGHGSQEMLTRSAQNTLAPGPLSQYPVVTVQHWNFSCLPSVSGDTNAGTAGQGFLAIAPDGTNYYFDWAARFPARTLSKPNDTAAAAAPPPTSSDSTTSGTSTTNLPPTGVIDAAGSTTTLLRTEIWLMPSKVVDRYGNTVTYTYDPAKPRNLTRISSSDGRVITLSYVTDARGFDHISSVYDGTRTWNYAYHVATVDGADISNLDRVTLPDASTWNLASFDGLLTAIKTDNNGGCEGQPALSTDKSVSGTLSHPTGAIATFTLTPTIHGRSHLQETCDGTSLATPRYFATMSTTAKSIAGPGLTTMNWTYNYGLPNESWNTCTACPDYKTVTVTDPASKVTRMNYGNQFDVNEGRLLLTDNIDGSNTLRSETRHYRPPAANDTIGFTSTDAAGDEQLSARLQPVDQRVTVQQGVTFTWEATLFDAFARPTQVNRFSTLGFTRTQKTVYVDNLGKWILGQIGSVTECTTADCSTGKIAVANVYDAATSTLTSVSHFGHLDNSYTYYGDGTVNSAKDGKNQATTYSNYKRGIPQNIAAPNGTSQSAVINNIGSIDSLTVGKDIPNNQPGFTTTFLYDAMGRLRQVAHPAGDSVAWNPTNLNTYQTSAIELLIAGGHWRQDVSTGSAREITYFDALLRPLYVERWDNTDVSATYRISKHLYDHEGRVTFASYPQRGFGATGIGVATAYDALGRTTAVSADSELGTLFTSTFYNGGFQKTVLDPRGNVATAHPSTTYSYQAFDEPVETAITAIQAPEGVAVSVDRDAFGKAKSITRSGAGKTATRSYLYDANERLCVTIEPETGFTVQDYDAANNIAWRATLPTRSQSTSCDPGSVAAASKTSFAYDTLNRLTGTTYGDGSAAITRSYTADGLLNTISSNGAVWTNTYNKRRLNERESLLYGSATYNIDRRYDVNGSLAQLIYPDNTTIAYNPNALGEARQIGAYASTLTYHPNGALSTFSYGNAVTHSTSQNVRGLPSQSLEGGVINDAYSYDENGNVAAITDQLTPSVSSRTMAYDYLDRLIRTSAPAMWGTASYTYDGLDNLTAVSISAGGTARSTVHTIDYAKNRLTSISGGPPGYNFSYTYDNYGNVQQRGVQAYVFDMGNRMRSATGKATYAYDGLGHRVSVVGADGVNRVQVYSQEGQLLYIVPSGGAPTKYVYLDRHVLAEVNGTTATYDHTDALGSPVAQTNSSGAILNRSRYEPYGYIVAGSPRTIGFTGHVNDNDTGLVYMQQRYYDSFAGRMLSIDPVMTDADTGRSFNRYNYANNNPYGNLDPDGRQAQAAVPVVGGIILIGGYKYATDPKARVVINRIFAAAISSGGDKKSSPADVPKSDGKKDTLQPGPHADDSVPARGPDRDFSNGERGQINEIGGNTGCHTCGSTDPGTSSGNFIPDHQPPNALNPSGGAQRLYPHCLTCSRVQGGQVRGEQSRQPTAPEPKKEPSN